MVSSALDATGTKVRHKSKNSGKAMLFLHITAVRDTLPFAFSAFVSAKLLEGL